MTFLRLIIISVRQIYSLSILQFLFMIVLYLDSESVFSANTFIQKRSFKNVHLKTFIVKTVNT